MTNHTIDRMFDLLDDWRHLPSYQLERRADIFFSVYLCEILENNFHTSLNRDVIPEFPLLKEPELEISLPNGTGKKSKPKRHSNKVDYLALSKDGSTAYFVELKTDNNSIKLSQIEYLVKAREKGMEKIVNEIAYLSEGTDQKGKYKHLANSINALDLSKVESIQLVFIIPTHVRAEAKAAQELEVTNAKIITYKDIIPIIANKDDHLAKRFCESLKKWATTIAGN